MERSDLTVVSDGGGSYRTDAPSHEGSTTLVLLLGDAEGVSDGRLSEDVQTAAATFAFLLGHQDATDLPNPIEIGDVLAAYEDAVEQILARRG